MTLIVSKIGPSRLALACRIESLAECLKHLLCSCGKIHTIQLRRCSRYPLLLLSSFSSLFCCCHCMCQNFFTAAMLHFTFGFPVKSYILLYTLTPFPPSHVPFSPHHPIPYAKPHRLLMHLLLYDHSNCTKRKVPSDLRLVARSGVFIMITRYAITWYAASVLEHDACT